MSENLFLPNIPNSPMFIGDEDKILTIEWQEFFRSLYDRVGGIIAPTILESSVLAIADIYSTPKDYTKRIDEIDEEVEEVEAQAYFFGTVL